MSAIPPNPSPERGPASGSRRGPRASGGRTRFWMGSQVALSVVLAAAAVVVINALVARPGLRLRWDLTAKEVNSLDPATERVLRQLPGEVTVDVFFRALPQPLTQLSSQVQARTLALLERMASVSSDRIVVRQNDLNDYVAIQQRLQDLRLRGLENCVVVSKGDQVQVVRERGQLAQFDLGNPNPDAYRPPALRAFEAEKHLLEAILSVTRGERPKVVFTSGHGEADPFETGPETAGVLESALRKDGFVIETWNPLEEDGFPEDAFLVAVVGPRDRMADSTLAQLDRFVEAGGRLLVAPHPDAEPLRASGLIPWMSRYGLEISEGTVMEPYADPTGTGALITGPRSEFLLVHPNHMKRHEIVQPFIDSGRAIAAVRSHAVRVARQPEGGLGLTMPLISSNPRISWLDTAPIDYRHEAELETIRGYDLAAVSEYGPSNESGTEGGTDQHLEKVRSRIVVLGSSAFLYSVMLESQGGQGSSLDFALNAFNWLVDREWRVNVSAKDPDLRLLSAEQIPWVSRWAVWGMPLFCLLLGVGIAYSRGRGGPRRQSA